MSWAHPGLVTVPHDASQTVATLAAHAAVQEDVQQLGVSAQIRVTQLSQVELSAAPVVHLEWLQLGLVITSVQRELIWQSWPE